MKKIFLGMAISGAMVLTSNVYAAGPYLVASVGQTKFESDFTVNSYSNWDEAKDSDTYASLGFGFSINKNFAVEVAYNDFGTGKDDIWFNLINLESKITSISVAALGKLPVSQKVSLVGKAGYEGWDAEFEVNDFAGNVFKPEDKGTEFFYGVGVSISFNEQFSVIAQYDIHKVDSSDNFEGNEFDIDVDLKVFSIGAQYNF